MLIKCPECQHDISDRAVACPNCGYPMAYISKAHVHRAAKRRRKLPNGFGTIKKLSGRRTRPYAAYPAIREYNLNGSPIPVPPIGYYKDYMAAFHALTAYNKNPYDLTAAGLTFAELYHAYFHNKYETPGKRQLSKNTRNATVSAFKNCAALHDRVFRTLRKSDLQAVVDSCPLGHSSLALIISLYKGMYKYALENELVEKDYSQFVTINIPDDNESGEPFTDDELRILWSHSDRADVQMVLIMIYTGFRISAFRNIEIHLDERYLKGGVKTKAGKDRIVPIHDAIFDFVAAFYENFPHFSDAHFREYDFYPLMSELGMAYTASGKKHTPHDARHTFSWLCDAYKVDEVTKHMLMGHSLGRDVERAVYGHRTLDELRAAIDMIQVPYIHSRQTV